MVNRGVTRHKSDWQETIRERKGLLKQLSSELIELETQLAEQLAAISAFEFKLRAKVRPWIGRLEALEEEIQEYLRQLRQEEPEYIDEDWSSWSIGEDGAASDGDYRYRESAIPAPSPELGRDLAAKLKRMYRKLAHRFHPDLALDETDRAYRTQIMMAINAAYAAGDLEKLRILALEPDAAKRADYAENDEQLAEALLQEIGRCWRRLEEVRLELATLADHESAKLMRRVAKAAADGRDLLAEMLAQLKATIQEKMAERDALKGQVENLSEDDLGLHGDAFADAVWDITLDQAFDENPEDQYRERIYRRRAQFPDEDDILDDSG